MREENSTTYEKERGKENIMNISRRQFFKGVGATLGMVGFHRFFTGETRSLHPVQR